MDSFICPECGNKLDEIKTIGHGGLSFILSCNKCGYYKNMI